MAFWCFGPPMAMKLGGVSSSPKTSLRRIQAAEASVPDLHHSIGCSDPCMRFCLCVALLFVLVVIFLFVRCMCVLFFYSYSKNNLFWF